MAQLSTGSFRFLRYEPGNPEFPTLPDGIRVAQLRNFGTGAGLAGNLAPSDIEQHSDAIGGPAEGFHGWYTNKTWRIPSRVDFGSIVTTTRKTISFTNTRRTSITATAISLPSDITAIGLTLPATIRPFESLTFELEAATAGEPDFEETGTLTTSAGDVPFTMVGERVLSVDLVPQRPIRETLLFRSDVLRSTNATEKVMSLAGSPISQIDELIRFSDDVRRMTFRNLMMAANTQLITARQLWFEATELTSVTPASATEVLFDTSNAQYEVGKPISIVLPDGTVISTNVETILADRLELSSAVGQEVPAGSLIMPVGLGYIGAFPNWQTYPINAEDARLMTALNRALDLSAALPSLFPTYNSLPVLEFDNEFERATKAGRTAVIEDAIDSGITNRASRPRHPLALDSQPFQISLSSRGDAWSWRRFLHYQLGSGRTMYVPTFRDDIPNVTTTATNLFSAPNTGFFANFGASPDGPRGSVRLDYGDGSPLYRDITNVVDNGSTEQFTLNSAVIAGTPVISFLQLARIAGDTASFTWFRPDDCILNFRYQTVQE